MQHLHSPSDRAETINPELIEKVAKLGYLVTVDLANGRYKGEKTGKEEGKSLFMNL